VSEILAKKGGFVPGKTNEFILRNSKAIASGKRT